MPDSEVSSHASSYRDWWHGEGRNEEGMTRSYSMAFEDDRDMHYVDLCASISFSFPLQLPISIPVSFTLTFTDHPICIVSSPLPNSATHLRETRLFRSKPRVWMRIWRE